MQDYIITYNSVKDAKLDRKNIKPIENVVVSANGTTLKDVLDDYAKLKLDYLKLKDEYLKTQSDNLMLFNKMNNTIDTLVKKVSKLENTVATLLSTSKNE